jgi:hypothetical protein
MMGQFCLAMKKVAKAGSLTDFSSCLKLPHHPPSPPSFWDCRTSALKPVAAWGTLDACMRLAGVLLGNSPARGIRATWVPYTLQ